MSVFDHAIRMADIIVEMMGSRCEVAVHDFSDIDHSLIYLAGALTDRKVGSPITNVVLKELKKPSSEIRDIANYKTVSRTGLIMKSSTVFLRNDDGDVIGALCINIDITTYLKWSKELNAFLDFDDPSSDKESFHTSVNDMVEDLVNGVIESFHKPANLLDMDKKIECVRLLEERGVFLIRGATEYVGSVLGVSKFTIYNYLQKIHSQTSAKN
jgi:predicted transcriptional regulator YheO